MSTGVLRTDKKDLRLKNLPTSHPSPGYAMKGYNLPLTARSIRDSTNDRYEVPTMSVTARSYATEDETDLRNYRGYNQMSGMYEPTSMATSRRFSRDTKPRNSPPAAPSVPIAGCQSPGAMAVTPRSPNLVAAANSSTPRTPCKRSMS